MRVVPEDLHILLRTSIHQVRIEGSTLRVRAAAAVGFFLRLLPGFSPPAGARGMLSHRMERGVIVSSQQPSRALPREHIIEQLQAHGLKPTEQRIRIAELLMSVPTHMTAEQILAAVRRGGERVSKATVYNTLKVLAQRGLVRQIHLDPERSVYDSTRTPHHHFHDLETGELRDIDPDDIAFSRFPALPDGMEAEVEVVIRLRRKKRIADSG
jgi:Fur family transcriptional regulator, iron response regulator